jgi:hypothetical protein
MDIISEDPLRAQPNNDFQNNTEDLVFKVEIISYDYDMERLESDLGPGRASPTENQTYMSGPVQKSDRRSWAGQRAFPLECGTVRE